jgi:hypothetical protein
LIDGSLVEIDIEIRPYYNHMSDCDSILIVFRVGFSPKLLESNKRIDFVLYCVSFNRIQYHVGKAEQRDYFELKAEQTNVFDV